MTELYRKVKCPHCSWSEFGAGEVVAMTPCSSCNSTGCTYELVDPHEICREELRQVVTQVREQCQEKIQYWREKHWNDIMSAKKSGYDDAKLECQERVERIFRDIDRSFSATNYHSPEAGKDLVNSIDINDWQALKKQEGVE